MDARGPTYTTGYTTSSPTLLICLVPAQAKNSIPPWNPAFCPTFPPFPAMLLWRLRLFHKGSMSTTNLLAAQSDKPKLLAPVWHTIGLVFFVLALSYLQSAHRGHLQNANTNRLAVYSFSICFELVLLAYVWFLGIRHTGIRFKDVIGGRWDTARDVWRDVGVAFVFWIVVVVTLVAVSQVLGQNPDMIKVLRAIAPRGVLELAIWILLSISAGFCEEFVFRGYLQKQLLALTGNVPAAIAGQAIIFGAAHAYQGVRGVLTITVYGALFGLLANVRNSLRPGMIQHVMQDSFSGILLSLAKHFPKLPT